MCLTVPGRIVKIDETDPALRRAEVEFSSVRKVVNLAFTPEAGLGDYVLVQAGFAIRRLGAAEAREALEYHQQLEALATSEPERGPLDGAART